MCFVVSWIEFEVWIIEMGHFAFDVIVAYWSFIALLEIVGEWVVGIEEFAKMRDLVGFFSDNRLVAKPFCKWIDDLLHVDGMIKKESEYILSQILLISLLDSLNKSGANNERVVTNKQSKYSSVILIIFDLFCVWYIPQESGIWKINMGGNLI